MPDTYAYKVRDRSGKLLEGKLEADSQPLVLSKLRSMGYIPVSIEREGEKATLKKEIKIPGFGNKVKTGEVAIFARQFATMINAGLTLLKSLAILEDQTENKAFAKIIGDVRKDIETGLSTSAAMTKHPKVFSQLFIAMVKSGETGGNLDEVLMRLATTMEKQVELKRKVKSAMTYPAVVGVLILLIFTAMLLFIVPVFKGMYADLGGTLPLPTRFLLKISEIVRKLWFLVVAVQVGTVFAFKRWIATEKGRAGWDSIKLRLPIAGKLIRKTAIARFTRTLSGMLRSGVPILEALDITSQTAGNEVVASAIREASNSVRNGEPLSKPLLAAPVIPPMVVQMMAVGEETGALDEMLEKIAEFYDAEVEATVEALTSLIEPLLIVFMGLVVGSMVVALYMPMFQIVSLVK